MFISVFLVTSLFICLVDLVCVKGVFFLYVFVGLRVCVWVMYMQVPKEARKGAASYGSLHLGLLQEPLVLSAVEPVSNPFSHLFLQTIVS